MAHERQRALAQELDARFPKEKSNIGQQMFRSNYYNGRMAGQTHAEARAESLAVVRRSRPSFTPVEHTSYT